MQTNVNQYYDIIVVGFIRFKNKHFNSNLYMFKSINVKNHSYNIEYLAKYLFYSS